jgi:hypothetical protein
LPPLSTRDTVAVETSASRATSWIVARPARSLVDFLTGSLDHVSGRFAAITGM